jgi:hypothetical protein
MDQKTCTNKPFLLQIHQFIQQPKELIMAEQKGIRLYFSEDWKFTPPGLMGFPKKASILYSTAFTTGVLWRKQTVTCFEVRAIDLDISLSNNDMLCLFLHFPDINCHLYSFLKKSIVGITDLEDQDIVPVAEEQPRNRPIEEILRDSLNPTATPPFLPHSHDA